MVRRNLEKRKMCYTNHTMPACSLAILIIVLVWVSTANWSKIIITAAAALILIGCCLTHKMAMRNV